MERAPVVATVIPCYQEAACIERCLSSLIGQTHPSHAHQIIVLDGGSTDGTQDMVERLARHSAEIGGPRIELHHNLFRFVPHARNLAMDLLGDEVEFVFEMIGHAWVPADHLEIRLARLASIESTQGIRLGGLGARVLESDLERGRTENWIEATLACPLGGSGQFARFSADGPTKTPPFTLYRREALEAVNGWNEVFITTQDSELNLRLIKAGWPLWRTAATHVRMAKRTTMKQWWRMGHRYGFWRMKHVMDAKARIQLAEFLPWIGLAIVLGLWIDGQSTSSVPNFLIPPMLYAAVLFAVGLGEARRWKDQSMVYGVPVMLVILHTAFSVGLLLGIFRPGRPPKDRVG